MSDPVPLYSIVDGPDEAPVLVLGNSLGTSTALWEPQLAELTERFRVVRYDHRGHGRSPVPPGPYRIEELGTDLLALLDSLGVHRADLAGVSLGGMVAMWLAATAPERVGRLVLVCTSARLGPKRMWRQRQVTVRAHGMAALVDAAVDRWFTGDFLDARSDVRHWAREQFLGTPVEGYAGCCAAIAELDLRRALGAITAPTLVLAGAADRATPPEHAELIGAGIAGATVRVLPDAAHLANVQQADAVSKLMSEFLGSAR